MSSHHNRRKRRQVHDVPVLVERIQKAEQGYESSGEAWRGRKRTGNYEIDNWPWLSPKFREAHNRRLQARGVPTIPPPAIDRYVPPPTQIIQPILRDETVQNAARAAVAHERNLMASFGDDEGFTVNGDRVKP